MVPIATKSDGFNLNKKTKISFRYSMATFWSLFSFFIKFFYHCTLWSLLEDRSVLSEQGSIFLENQLSEQAELSDQGGISFESC